MNFFNRGKTLISDFNAYPVICSLIIGLLSSFIFYPNIFLLKASPMFQTTWELIDPTVSLLNFIPGVDLVRHEFLHNFNLLWSGLKNFGSPILANEIQAAPIFPLTLALIWIPDPYFWNFFVIIRLCLMGAAALLIARNLFRLSWFGSAIFMLILVYDPIVSRYINHPWSNGLMSGLWLMYFLSAAIYHGFFKTNKDFLLNTFGITFSTYSVITSGFPEAMLMVLILCLIIFVFTFYDFIGKRGRQSFYPLVIGLGVGGLTGLLFASMQIFALLEYLSNVPADFRTGFGSQQFSSFKDFYKVVARFQAEKVEGELVEVLGLVPCALCIYGIFNFKTIFKKNKTAFFIAVSSLVFYVLKAFPIWPLFNDLISKVPILSQSWFLVYFYPIFLFGFAFFCSKGAELLFDINKNRINKIDLTLLFASIVLVVTIEYLAIKNFDFKLNWYLLGSNAILAAFILLLNELFRYQVSSKNSCIYIYKALLLLMMCATCFLGKPTHFLEYEDGRYHEFRALMGIGGMVSSSSITGRDPIFNYRDGSDEGSAIFSGLGTIDNGAPAILTERAVALRTALFKTDWNGYLPISSQKRGDAYSIVGRNIYYILDMSKKLEFNGVYLGNHKSRNIYYDPETVGRAYIPSKCLVAKNIEVASEILRDQVAFHRGNAILDGKLSEDLYKYCLNNSIGSESYKNLSIIEDLGSRLALERVVGPNLIVVNDSYYDGWSAKDKISGELLNIFPANINFKAIFLPKNKIYEIELVYRPSWLRISYLLVGLGCIIWLLCIVLMLRYKR